MHSNKLKAKPSPSRATLFEFEAIGTWWRIELLQSVGKEEAAELLEAIRARIDDFDQTYSRFRADSLVTAMSQRSGLYTLPEDAKALFALYRQLYDVTDGAVTPLIGQGLSDAGYDASYRLRPRPIRETPAWDDVLMYRHPILEIKTPVLLDVGAAGKGYLADIVAGLIEERRIGEYCINAGGDFVCRSKKGKAVQIGLEHPLDTSQVIGVATVANQSLCASAGNRRAWGKYHHMLDPRSKTSPKAITATWVVAKNGLLADGLATALFFVSADKLRRVFEFEYALVKADLSLEKSQQFPAEFFTEEKVNVTTA